MFDATIIVATFGPDKWIDLANERAIPSAHRVAEVGDVIHVHGETLALARNEGAAQAHSDWLVFLDADDELDFEYFLQAERKLKMEPEADIMVPNVQYIHDDVEDIPVRLGPFKLRDMNYIVVGAPVRKVIFDKAGGFWGERGWEDWSLWLRADHLGANIVPCPRAIYRAHMNRKGRNQLHDPQGLRKEILTKFDAWCGQ